MIPIHITIENENIEIPSRLYRAIQSDRSDSPRKPDKKSLLDYAVKIEHTNDIVSLDTQMLIQISELHLEGNNPRASVFYLAIYASHKAYKYLESGQPQESLGILTDSLVLEHKVLPYCSPEISRSYTRRISLQTEEAMDLFASLGSAEAIISSKDDITTLLRIVETVWEPVSQSFIRDILQIIDELPQLREDRLFAHSKATTDRLAETRRQIGRSANIANKRKNLLLQLTESWLQIVQQEMMLIANAQYSSEGLDNDSIRKQAYSLIGKVEQRLRRIVLEKYSCQYGEGWLDHIQSQHKTMYQTWTSNFQRDQAAFKAYGSRSNAILEYARFEDLTELITAQWHLFREILDLGFDKRNKAAFYDIMAQVAKVRNPLAHYRSIPENELLRVRVLCTDILLALDRAGER